MKLYTEMTKFELQSAYDESLAAYNAFKSKGLALDISRGKPSAEQLDLCADMLDVISSQSSPLTQEDVDTRNYGILDGIPETKRLFSEMLGVPVGNILVGGSSSLNMMYDTIIRSMILGVCGSTPWSQLGQQLKFLCPVPGYDRHFAICQQLGIQMINIPMDENGPDMGMIAQLVSEDESIKGIWCVPKYSNPTGITFSDAVVEAFAALKPKAPDFRIFWDNAYAVHDLNAQSDCLLNIFEACKRYDSMDMVYEFTSTSKISYSGAGVAAMAASENNLNFIKKCIAIQTIGHDKVNQLRHARYFKDMQGINAHMQKHQKILAPKFHVVIGALDQRIAPIGLASYTRPNGGYFISVDVMPGCATRVYQLCKDAGVVLTPAGAPYPYGRDPQDQTLRIAPTYPPIEELRVAVDLLCECIKLASLERLMDKAALA